MWMLEVRGIVESRTMLARVARPVASRVLSRATAAPAFAAVQRVWHSSPSMQDLEQREKKNNSKSSSPGKPLVKNEREVNVASNNYYDGLGSHYRMFQRDWDGMMMKERAAFKEAFEGKGVKRVLDASCGSGEQAIALAGLDLEVVATDPSGGLVEICAENAAKYGFSKKFTAKQSDFLNLPKDVEGPFDAIVTKGSSLPHLHTDSDLLQALKNFYALLRPGGVVNIGVRDYDWFIKQKQEIYPRQVRVGDHINEHIMFDVWDWHKGSEGQQLVNFNTFHINGDGPSYITNKHVTTFRALFRHEMEGLLKEAGFENIEANKINGWLWENVYSAQRPQ